MTEAECVAKKWGSSLGIVIPKNIVIEDDIQLNEKITVDFKKKPRVRDFFGILPKLKQKIDTRKLIAEARKGWDF